MLLSAASLTRTPFPAVPRLQPQQPSAGMATLRDIRIRLKSVASIGKITASMKMVAAARLRVAEITLKKIARPFAEAANKPLNNVLAKALPERDGKKQLIVVVTSDRGLCGSVNSSVVKMVKSDIAKVPADMVRLAIAGTKGKAGMLRDRGEQITSVCVDLAKRLPINFADVCSFADRIVKTPDVEVVTVYHQRFVSLITNELRQVRIPNKQTLLREVDLSKYEFDEMKEATLDNLYEWYVATTLYGAITEHSTAELGARMSAMDGATKNSKDMLSRLTIQYNRRRQAAITTELCEIVAGAESLKG